MFQMFEMWIDSDIGYSFQRKPDKKFRWENETWLLLRRTSHHSVCAEPSASNVPEHLRLFPLGSFSFFIRVYSGGYFLHFSSNVSGCWRIKFKLVHTYFISQSCSKERNWNSSRFIKKKTGMWHGKTLKMVIFEIWFSRISQGFPFETLENRLLLGTKTRSERPQSWVWCTFAQGSAHSWSCRQSLTTHKCIRKYRPEQELEHQWAWLLTGTTYRTHDTSSVGRSWANLEQLVGSRK